MPHNVVGSLVVLIQSYLFSNLIQNRYINSCSLPKSFFLRLSPFPFSFSFFCFPFSFQREGSKFFSLYPNFPKPNYYYYNVALQKIYAHIKFNYCYKILIFYFKISEVKPIDLPNNGISDLKIREDKKLFVTAGWDHR